jgi:hypothetical protein
MASNRSLIKFPILLRTMFLSCVSARTHGYSVRRTANDSWEAHYVGHDNYSLETDRAPSKQDSPIPIFRCIRVVTASHHFVCCDCGAQQRVGLTCVHATAVMEDCFHDWKGPTHHDVSPGWWVSWMEFAHKTQTKPMTTAMLALMENEVPRPRMPGSLPTTDRYFPVSETSQFDNA